MPKARITVTGDIGGAPMNSTWERTADGSIRHQVALADPTAGTLSTRSTDTTGVVTAEGHGLAMNDVVDLYWDGGRRYDVDVDAVNGDDVTFSGGAGDVLPVQDTAVTIAEQQVIDTTFAGDDLAAIGAVCPQRGHLSFFATGGNELSVDLVAGEAWEWHDAGTAANPLAGDAITSIRATKGTVTGAATNVEMGILYDSTP